MKRVVAFVLLAVLSGSWVAPAQAQQMSVAEYQRKSAKDAKKQQKMQAKSAKLQSKAQKKADKAQKKQLKAGQKADAKANRQLH
jgi:Skp family chaperone for outer membrane proteins